MHRGKGGDTDEISYRIIKGEDCVVVVVSASFSKLFSLKIRKETFQKDMEKLDILLKGLNIDKNKLYGDIFKNLFENCAEAIKCLYKGKLIEKKELYKLPYSRVTISKAIKMLEASGELHRIGDYVYIL